MPRSRCAGDVPVSAAGAIFVISSGHVDQRGNPKLPVACWNLGVRTPDTWHSKREEPNTWHHNFFFLELWGQNLNVSKPSVASIDPNLMRDLFVEISTFWGVVGHFLRRISPLDPLRWLRWSEVYFSIFTFMFLSFNGNLGSLRETLFALYGYCLIHYG